MFVLEREYQRAQGKVLDRVKKAVGGSVDSKNYKARWGGEMSVDRGNLEPLMKSLF